MYESDVSRVVRRGRPRKCWLDGVKEVLARKGLNIQEAKVSMQDRNEWCSVCMGGGGGTCRWRVSSRMYEAARWELSIPCCVHIFTGLEDLSMELRVRTSINLCTEGHFPAYNPMWSLCLPTAKKHVLMLASHMAIHPRGPS